jgi:hypothetical protein
VQQLGHARADGARELVEHVPPLLRDAELQLHEVHHLLPQPGRQVVVHAVRVQVLQLHALEKSVKGEKFEVYEVCRSIAQVGWQVVVHGVRVQVLQILALCREGGRRGSKREEGREVQREKREVYEVCQCVGGMCTHYVCRSFSSSRCAGKGRGEVLRKTIYLFCFLEQAQTTAQSLTIRRSTPRRGGKVTKGEEGEKFQSFMEAKR